MFVSSGGDHEEETGIKTKSLRNSTNFISIAVSRQNDNVIARAK